MLGNFEPKRQDINLSRKLLNSSDYAAFSDIFLCDHTFTMTKANALLSSYWNTQIGNENIFPIHDLKNTIPDIEESTYNTSILGIRFIAKTGKYKFTVFLNVDKDFYEMLKSYEDSGYYAYFSDINRNFIGKESGSNFLPISIDNFKVNKLVIGSVGSPSWTSITFDFTDYKEIIDAYIFKPTFEACELGNELVYLSINQINGTTIDITVVDYCGNLIANLISSDFTIYDNILDLTIYTFTETSTGVYRIIADSSYYNGTIKLISENYHSKIGYSYSVPEFNPLEFSGEFKIA